MKKIRAIIFDMDGTLYPFDRGSGATFMESTFGKKIISNSHNFFARTFSLSNQEAEKKFEELKEKFRGEVSLGLEQEHGIPRETYFAATWDLQPEEFIDLQPTLRSQLSALPVPTAILSAAPNIWIRRVLEFLEVHDVFGSAIFSGEPDIRKPDPRAFEQIADFLKIPATEILSIGDQEHTDILPAKKLGMMTLHIRKKIDTKERSAADYAAGNITDALELLQKEKLI